ncbi:hypothetical protein ACJMK2_011244 [Sinanodonta woodiana]|uniref:THAP-type domain-containing protein n=1 Tax=Sinanodonta woodiana TaxID=1069815 RepID=A0ABD3V6S6_SINWO
MVNTCWVKDCTNRADDSVKRSFYTIPVVRKFEGEQTNTLSDERRRTWLANINRKELPSKHSKICSDHFIQGKPADLYNRSHPDWAPTLKLCNLSGPFKPKKKIKAVETDMERPKSLMARAQTWSSYKHNNTIKFLIGITPQGSISFISKAWGGRASDKYITENCGFLSKLLPGDIVLVDRGFNISDSIGMYCAKIIVPSFTKGKSQLSPIDVENSRKIAH